MIAITLSKCIRAVGNLDLGMRRRDVRAVAGSFEDLPALLIILVASSVLIVTIAGSYAAYHSYLDGLRLHEEAVQFSQAVRTYDILTWNGEEGRFLASKLNENSRAQMVLDFPPESLGFHYNVRIQDVSTYDYRYDWWAGEEIPAGITRESVTSPVTIRNEAGQSHAAHLIVTIWR